MNRESFGMVTGLCVLSYYRIWTSTKTSFAAKIFSDWPLTRSFFAVKSQQNCLVSDSSPS